MCCSLHKCIWFYYAVARTLDGVRSVPLEDGTLLLVTIVIKNDISSLFEEAASIASLVQKRREVKVNPGRTNMKFHHVIKLMTVAGMHVNRILSRLSTVKVFMEISLTFALMR